MIYLIYNKKLFWDKSIKLLSILFIIIILSGCISSGKFRIPEPLPDDRRDIPLPEESEISLYKDVIDKLFVMPLDQLFDLSRSFRKLANKPKQALNFDAFDEVSNSSWFTNRNAVKQMSLDEIARGPNTGEGPDQSGPWTIIKAKTEGVTPGFTIMDSKGVRYPIKFDPPGYSELASGAEIVSTKLFYAAGYNVPENYIVYFHPDSLELGEGVDFTDERGRERSMTQQDLDAILQNIDYLPDGRIRAMASKFIEGTPIGPYKYEKTRRDDPNDIIPHQHRRELRGLRVMAAWLNHFDTKAGNSHDAYVTENGRSYVKHYLMDFGSTFGSGANGPMPSYVGFENAFDTDQIFTNLVSLGLYVPISEKSYEIKYPSIGFYMSQYFQPQKYKSHLPNPAFRNMTNRDGFWGAKLVMSFTDEQLKTAVEQGRYSDPKASSYLLKILKERRDIVGRYWFSKMNPLDKFEIREKSDGKQELCFVDLAVKGGLESADQSSYQYLIKQNESAVVKARGIIQNSSIPLPSIQELTQNNPTKQNLGEAVWEVKILTRRSEQGSWSKWIKVFFRIDDKSGEYVLLGLQRQE